VIFLVTVLVIIFDQLSKFILSNYLTLYKSVPVIKNIFHLTLVHNTGIAFGMFKGNSGIILLVTILGLIIIIYYLKKDFFSNSHHARIPFFDKLSVGFILGGAIANMVDRIRLGYVIDFLDFRVWPVFNLADSCITIGAVILIFKTFFPIKSKN